MRATLMVALGLVAFLACEVHAVLAQAPSEEGEFDPPPTKEEIGTSITPIPVIYYTPETKLAFGGAATILYRPDDSTILDRPSTFTPALIYTTRSQVLFYLGGNHYWSKGRHQISPGISYRKFPDSFYGLGNDTSVDDAEDFTDEGWSIYADYLREIVSRWRAGFGWNYSNSSITGTSDGDRLESEPIPGSEGGTVIGMGILLGWDNRDNVSFPRSGQFHQFSLRFHDDAWGSDYTFSLSSLDLRGYLPIARDSALAGRALVQTSSGVIPFQVMPRLGGANLLRGYYEGRFRAPSLIAFQAEMRVKAWKRLGGAIFAGVGQVAEEIDSFGTNRFRQSFGIGLRILLVSEEKLHLRFDFGWGEDSSGLYFSLGEAF